MMVYLTNVIIVYGAAVRPIKRQLDIPQATLATAVVTAMMVLLSALWLSWKSRRPRKTGDRLPSSAKLV